MFFLLLFSSSVCVFLHAFDSTSRGLLFVDAACVLNAPKIVFTVELCLVLGLIVPISVSLSGVVDNLMIMLELKVRLLILSLALSLSA